jgi:hypothetical protein
MKIARRKTETWKMQARPRVSVFLCIRADRLFLEAAINKETRNGCFS